MFLCAYIIERTTNEKHYRQTDKKNKSRMYWVQPGGQSIGDQVFASFIGYSSSSYYIRSTKASRKKDNAPLLWLAVTTTIAGFIAQFVGLRALHASVILALIGATMIMAIIRAMLRTQRMDKTKNILASKDIPIDNGYEYKYQHTIAENPKLLHGYELDLCAMHLYDACFVFVVPTPGRKLESRIIPKKRKRRDFSN
ncbi:hypothetical protein ABW20_dc0109745 [Dactylellina cionopaga]|nr:hypothetical protein ABW20_dc0109745 [Dactylellina cionopaga]